MALAVVGLLMLAATGCADRVPPPYIERSPVRIPEREYRIFMPAMLGAPNKLGIAGCPPTCEGMGCAWCYSWALNPGVVAGVETVGMVWDETHVDDPHLAKSAWIMGFNEPDQAIQANLTPQQAVEPWARVEARFRAYRLVCPAPSHLHPEWLGQFYEAFRAAKGRYPDCDALASHCYRDNAQQCIDDVRALIGEAQRRKVGEVWVTEFHFSQEAEARRFVAYLESEPLVTRYAPYVSRSECESTEFWDCGEGGDPALYDANWNLTPKGKWYARPTPEPW